MAALDPAARKRVLKVIAISLLLDLVRQRLRVPCASSADRNSIQISFTFILPLFPKLLEFYRDREGEEPSLDDNGTRTLLQTVLSGLHRYKAAFSRPIESQHDIVLLGGALGSMFSYVCPIQSLASRGMLTPSCNPGSFRPLPPLSSAPSPIDTAVARPS